MTKRQKLVIAVLALANVLAVTGLIVWVTGIRRTPVMSSPSSVPSTQSAAPSPTPRTAVSTSVVEIGPLEPCEWRAAELLAAAGLAGTVTYSRTQLLRFDIHSPLAPGRAPDDAAQLVWVALDIAVALQNTEECGAFKYLSIDVFTPSAEGNAQITAAVDAEDLAAFYDGRLTEERFIDRVTYRTYPVTPE